jgi:hypothetical protein
MALGALLGIRTTEGSYKCTSASTTKIGLFKTYYLNFFFFDSWRSLLLAPSNAFSLLLSRTFPCSEDTEAGTQDSALSMEGAGD